jgi:Tfp pilus assembly protein PilV
MSAAAALRHDESGFGLIEVVVSSLLLVLVASGVYLGLDAASATSGVNKHRSIATQIAQQDQDRMRAMAVGELSNYRDSTTTRVGPVTYTVVSSSSWVTDSTGTASCTSGQARAHYLRIASSVTWPSMHIRPVTVESVVAPPAGSFGTDLGSLAVQVRDRTGAGVQGVTVSLTGPQSYTDTTNEIGCVLWGFLPVVRGSSYTVSLAKTGYVDPSGVAAPSRAAGVVGESTSTVAFDYDLGGRIQATYESVDSSTGRAVPANGTAFTAVTSHLAVPLAPFGDGQPHTSYTSGLLFPFTDPYGVYAGTCAGADPALHGNPSQLALVPPGGVASVIVREPPVDLLVTRGGRPLQGATVQLTGTGSGCGALPSRTTGADGYVTDRALPYGTYDVCVQATVSGTTYFARGAVANTAPGGVPVGRATYDLTTAGTCP